MVSKRSRGFPFAKPANFFEPKVGHESDIVGRIPPGGFPPPKKSRRKIKAVLTKKKIPPR
jgi:hypothetical protein